MQNNKGKELSAMTQTVNLLNANIFADTVPTLWQNKQRNSQISWPNIYAH